MRLWYNILRFNFIVQRHVHWLLKIVAMGKSVILFGAWHKQILSFHTRFMQIKNYWVGKFENHIRVCDENHRHRLCFCFANIFIPKFHGIKIFKLKSKLLIFQFCFVAVKWCPQDLNIVMSSRYCGSSHICKNKYDEGSSRWLWPWTWKLHTLHYTYMSASHTRIPHRKHYFNSSNWWKTTCLLE